MKRWEPLRRGIARDWFVNFYLIIMVVILLLETLFCVSVRSYYYNSVINSADAYMKNFSLLSTYDYSEFESRAQKYAEDFEYKDLMEVQVINKDGKIIVSTTGFEPEQSKPADYTAALNSPSGSATWQGKSATGERVLAKTTLLTDFGSGSNGTVRFVVSLTNTTRQIWLVTVIAILVGIGVLLLALFSGSYFIKSIVRPVIEVSGMARKIALGDFGTRIEVSHRNEIGELCDSLNNMAAELQQAENLKNEFISSVSHELRTPLTAIRGWGETAKMSLGSDPELVEKGLDVVLSESARMSDLVEDLLDFSRMQSGNFNIDARLILTSSVLSEAVEMYVELARQRSVDLSYLPPKNESKIFADPNRLKQVFINIIDNAIKYTDGTGQVLISQFEEDGCVTVKITDTGTGIPEAAIDRVKEKFFRYSKTVRGSGIGLAVADEIIRQHNGLLFLESKEGVGTTVTVILPISDKQEETVDELKLAPTGGEPELQETPPAEGEENTDE